VKTAHPPECTGSKECGTIMRSCRDDGRDEAGQWFSSAACATAFHPDRIQVPGGDTGGVWVTLKLPGNCVCQMPDGRIMANDGTLKVAP